MDNLDSLTSWPNSALFSTFLTTLLFLATYSLNSSISALLYYLGFNSCLPGLLSVKVLRLYISSFYSGSWILTFVFFSASYKRGCESGLKLNSTLFFGLLMVSFLLASFESESNSWNIFNYMLSCWMSCELKQETILCFYISNFIISS